MMPGVYCSAVARVERFLYRCPVMDVTLTDDQQLLRTTAASLADDLGCPNADALEDVRTDVWNPLVGLGLPTLRSPTLSGVEGTGVEVALVVEEFGRTLSAAPTVGQAVLVPDLLVAARRTPPSNGWPVVTCGWRPRSAPTSPALRSSVTTRWRSTRATRRTR